jgi:hypothetical protein
VGVCLFRSVCVGKGRGIGNGGPNPSGDDSTVGVLVDLERKEGRGGCIGFYRNRQKIVAGFPEGVTGPLVLGVRTGTREHLGQHAAEARQSPTLLPERTHPPLPKDQGVLARALIKKLS